MAKTLTLQIHYGGAWHDAATVQFEQADKGVAGRTRVEYDDAYYFDVGDPERPETGARDARALSVSCPVTLDVRAYRGWPPFLVDLLPQGPLRRKFARERELDGPDDPRLDLLLLETAATAPIGNLRVKEAWKLEQARLLHETVPGVTWGEILDRSDRFRELADRFTGLASGSSGVQGEWPKILMTLADDGLWYPTPAISDDRARDHVIAKLRKTDERTDRLILEAEPPYLEVARELGLKVGRAMTGHGTAVIIPRFDRETPGAGQVVRHGQESLYAALNVPGFAGALRHEDCVAKLAEVCDDAANDVAEYVARDIVNRVFGNVDNHGRNTALRRRADGRIDLAPFFDFAPMRMDPRGVAFATTWTCLRGSGETMNLPRVIDAAAEAAGMDPEALRPKIAGRLVGLHDALDLARRHRVPDDVIDGALRFDADLSEQLEMIGARRDAAPHP